LFLFLSCCYSFLTVLTHVVYTTLGLLVDRSVVELVVCDHFLRDGHGPLVPWRSFWLWFWFLGSG
jgi:hypothetical protein